MNKIKLRKTVLIIPALVAIYLILLIPLESTPVIRYSLKKPFIWNRDSLWHSLEGDYVRAFREKREWNNARIDSLLQISRAELIKLSDLSLSASDSRFGMLENIIFHVAPLIPANSQRFSDYINFYSDLRNFVKEKSRGWDLNSSEARNTLYKLLYGNRTAVEEIMLQLPPDKVSPLVKGIDEPSSTPSAKILGVEIHSGDILISRGGAPTSALIARGNDYPGNFSHIALVHIDPKTNLVSIIESHIERGVTVSTLEQYLEDVKLRVMVLRLRFELIKNNPMLPHLAASYALKSASEKHIPYDFEMNYNDYSKQFCSEVASSAYNHFGIKLWTGLSNISSKGTRNWLSAFGVKYFETFEPSDLEYDPQLSVVAEWRDPQTLYKDHVDNAVTDVMLERADSGAVLYYDWFLLPVGRVLKLYSTILNYFGSEGPIPEGMNTGAALKNKKYSEIHGRIKERLLVLAGQFKKQKGYTPPYWELVSLARQARDELKLI